MDYYLGVKIVQAEHEERGGEEGYKVIYEDGYVSWSPKKVFENAYLNLGDRKDRVAPHVVEDFIINSKHTTLKDGISPGATLTTALIANGFTQYDIDLDGNFLESEKRIKSHIWRALSFILQWGKAGLIG